jgi:hypothetical protein
VPVKRLEIRLSAGVRGGSSRVALSGVWPDSPKALPRAYFGTEEDFAYKMFVPG